MSTVYITSDLHLGHKLASELRGFSSVSEHDDVIISNIQSAVGKNDKLIILGDVAFNREGLLKLLNVHCRKEMLLGNHDSLSMYTYLEIFYKIHGFYRYKDFWLSHCPIHPQEIYRCRGNIHGHIHDGAATKPIGYPYFNVNVDFHNLKPVPFHNIVGRFDNNE